MTLLRETPKDHGLLLDHDPKGMRRISITLAGRTSKRNGRRLQNAVGRAIRPVLSSRPPQCCGRCRGSAFSPKT